ncbi:hypothetical protein C1704_17325 [Caldimonas caldifontis]|uniref:GPI inositol-deacylase PGAP1-like alpha/beta domain-containing protein n=2 Tax=Caldimonas caldifontis TaxID=1452508 RepID=A0A2S5SQ53_9BURK|nr:hypothetical protein C1704_17325 [Caldimonas caldifontis]
MVVDDDGKVPTDMKLPAEELKRRGWGEIAAMSYGPALRWLEEHLNDFGSYQNGLRAQLKRQTLGADLGEQPLGEEEVRLSYRYRFPVHAFGYNWLDDNAQSAQALGRRIDEIIERYARADRMRCEKVILVTHSMGGLVARHCCEVLGWRDKIYGIVHGVMPATGAAAVYRRMKAGTEGTWGVAQVLGADAAEVTAVLSGAPGPLQLLPSPEYGNGWLKIRAGAQELALSRSTPCAAPGGACATRSSSIRSTRSKTHASAGSRWRGIGVCSKHTFVPLASFTKPFHSATTPTPTPSAATARGTRLTAR